MDVLRFDALVRQLGQGESRRRFLGLVGGTTLGGLAAVGLASESDARKKKKKKSCKKKKCGECQACKKGKCLAKTDGTACSGGTCEDGVCRSVNNCPPAQVCDLAETCCTDGINSVDGVSYCGADQQAICTCPAGDDFCQGTDGAQCCLSGDACHESGACVTETCSASNDFCEMEFAACGNGCGCVSSVDGVNACASFATFACPTSSECANDAQCPGDDICVNVGCRCGGGTLGLCFSACAVPRQGAARAANQRLRVGPLR